MAASQLHDWVQGTAAFLASQESSLPGPRAGEVQAVQDLVADAVAKHVQGQAGPGALHKLEAQLPSPKNKGHFIW